MGHPQQHPASRRRRGRRRRSLTLTPPPRISILTISPCVFLEPVTPEYFSFVLAADPSGLLLLQATLGRPWTREITDGPSVHWHNSEPRYFVLDANAASAFRLPEPKPVDIMHQALLSLIASPGGDGYYMVSELRPSWAGFGMIDGWSVLVAEQSQSSSLRRKVA
ncbi:hypothetical protein ZWY2020_033581 [Hordeum vulgare]|nr:hypothetical protein ZWY2020_033579 [Hordeum vulgare]KAI5006338.1 hypothetical protein ZWY2020_033581 [Hordeum vulgare]